jgi:hypothetical protein
VAQDQSYVNNLLISPSAGASVLDVNNVFMPPSPPNSYTIETSPTMSVSNGTVCSGANFTLVPSGAYSYTYSGGSAVVSPTVNSSYTIVGASYGGCLSANTVVATVSVVANPTITVNSGTICAGQPFTLIPSGAVSYTYSSGLPVVFPVGNSTYFVIGKDNAGCVSAPVYATVTVNSVQVTANTSTGSVCKGDPVTLSGGGASTYVWSGGISNNVAFVPQLTAVYTVTGTALNGCSATASVQVTVKPLPTVNGSAGKPVICTGEDVQLLGLGAVSFTWIPGGGTGLTQTVNPVTTTVYTVTGTDFFGCKASGTVTVEVSECLAIASTSATAGMNVYPNPVRGQLMISCDIAQDAVFEIYSASGQLMSSGIMQQRNTVVDVAKYAKGMYIVHVTSGGIKKTQKIVVE